MGRNGSPAERNRPLEVEVRPPSPYRLPRGSSDRTLRTRGGVAARLLHVGGSPVLVRAWQPARDRVRFRAEAVDPELISRPPIVAAPDRGPAAGAQPAEGGGGGGPPPPGGPRPPPLPPPLPP